MDRLIQTLGKLNRDGLDGNTNILNVKGKGKDSLLLMEQCYAQECERLAFQHIDLSDSDGNNGLSFKDFNYWEIARNSAGQTRIPKDRLHLVKELAVTATCLPPGIWIRVDEVRNDVMYAHTLFTCSL
jgi:baculoviral IAP repeat-containing protein 6